MRAHETHWARNAIRISASGEAPAPERLVGDEHHRRDAHPPDDHVAGVVDGRGRGLRVGALVEPDGLEVERPGPPRRARGVGRGQAGCGSRTSAWVSSSQRLAACGPRGQPVDDLVVLEQGPRHVRGRRTRPAGSRAATPPARRPGCPGPSPGGPSPPGRARRAAAPSRPSPGRTRSRQGAEAQPPAEPERPVGEQPEHDQREARPRWA